MRSSSNRKPFYLYLRKSSGTYYVEVRDPSSGVLLPARSTGKRKYREAERVAWEWHLNGLPSKRSGEAIAPAKAAEFEEALSYLKDTNIGQDEAERLLSLLKRRGLVASATTKEVGPSICGWLAAFWDYDTSLYVADRLSHGHSISRSHCEIMQAKVRNYWIPYFGDIRRSDITRETIKKFSIHVAGLTRTVKRNGEEKTIPLAGSTIDDIMKAGSVAFNYAESMGEIRDNPYDGFLKFIRPGTVRGILADAEVHQLFTIGEWVGSPANRLGNLLASQTGLRLGEVVGLRVQDVNVDSIHVRHSWNRLAGLKAPKTRKSVRVVPLLPETREALLAWASRNPHYAPESFVFWTDDPGKPWAGKNMKEALYKALASIGITEAKREARALTFHGWRHYVASLLDRTVAERAARLVTGHSNTKVFQGYSDHMTEQDMAKMKTAVGQTFADIIPFPDGKEVSEQ